MKTFKAKAVPSTQGDLFGAEQIAAIYKSRPDAPIDNATLYSMVAKRGGLPKEVMEERVPVGRSGQRHSLERRAIRWSQQDLRRAGILERVPGARGIWRLTEDAKRDLNMAKPGVKVIAFRTDLGVAVFGPSGDIFKNLDIPIMAIVTSPPYPLAHSRRYGNPDQKEIVKFIMDTLEPIIERLDERGSLALNISQDIFMPGSPARSTYVERLVIALEDAGLSLMERLIWQSNKAPGPMQWASKTRQQLNVAYEPIIVMAKNPLKFKGDNRRVLEQHSERHLALIEKGGEKRATCHGDGAYRLRVGSFGQATDGRIPKNILQRGIRCAHGNRYKKAAEALGLPVHGAGQPYSVPEFLIKWLTEEGDTVADPFGGRLMTSLAAEMLGRLWITGERALQYVRGGAELFRDRPGFYLNAQLEQAFAGAGQR
ncbi:site-specific DNA-methyltransferase [Pseudomonas sp. P66]|uniref:Site-specific DNA-methyltransferase n=1 Tax=Pseudomonas arcuscaelestis TaxID=2710591 RepID=A0ABS2BZV6_9PSED|nr:site-specific DNA-methyltransferase [Pseudomonas arcuscaelestis]MBM5459010.1 site-specific DNA-methyltransferase [Pseudomonas arcuscaelestis]